MALKFKGSIPVGGQTPPTSIAALSNSMVVLFKLESPQK